MPSDPSVLAFSGGVGGAKLALGLYRVLEPWNLAVVANYVNILRRIQPDVVFAALKRTGGW